MERLDALRLGLKTYSTGRPCSRGHDAPRYVSTLGCTECLRQSKRAAPVLGGSLPPHLEAIRAAIDADARILDLDRAALDERARALEDRRSSLQARVNEWRVAQRNWAEQASQNARMNRHRERVFAWGLERYEGAWIEMAASLATLRGVPADAKPRRKNGRVTIWAHPDDHAILKAEEARLRALLPAPAPPNREQVERLLTPPSTVRRLARHSREERHA